MNRVMEAPKRVAPLARLPEFKPGDRVVSIGFPRAWMTVEKVEATGMDIWCECRFGSIGCFAGRFRQGELRHSSSGRSGRKAR